MELNTKYSKNIGEYLSNLHNSTVSMYKFAEEAKAKNLDPEDKVPIKLAVNIGEKVEGLMSSLIPELSGSGLAQELKELEKTYGAGDWRVSLKIAEQISNEKFCKFKDKTEAILTSVRTGLAYMTQGIVSAPLEGIIDAKLKKRKDGKEYLAVYYGGPIRGAGGTGQSISIMIADYIRKLKGVSPYDPTEDEIKRYYTEVTDYYERVERKQYKPSEKEMEFLISHCPIEINGDASSRLEVSNFKHLDRVETDRIRSGVALLLTDGLPLKAGKLWKQVSKWGKDFNLEWDWLDGFLKLKTKIHSESKKEKKKEDEKKLKPNYYFISEIVAGRPVFTYPLHKNGFRCRYGRSRMTGHGAWGIPPATMVIVRNFLAVGTQMRVERPGKSTALTPCDTIEGPIVKLKNGNVVQVNTKTQAEELVKDVEEILFMGDLLISHGDFSEQGEKLAPPGYCEEFWALEVKEKIKDVKKTSKELNIDLEKLFENPITTKITPKQAIQISEKLKVPLHPKYTYRWLLLTKEEFETTIKYLKNLNNQELPLTEDKKFLENIGLEHIIRGNKIKISKEDEEILKYILKNLKEIKGKNGLECLQSLPIEIRDKIGLTIGARMGRPEKAKVRKLKGSPNVLFPVGKEGGRLRALQSALQVGTIRGDFPIYQCPKCNKRSIYPYCIECGGKTEEWRVCPVCKKKVRKKKCHKETIPFERTKIDINKYLASSKKRLRVNYVPELIKGVRGTSNRKHTPENLTKGILRARSKLTVNKDGTIRYDMTELPITHFKPDEVCLSLEKAKEIGYTKDIHGKPLTDGNQVVELKPQDVILPEDAGATLFHVGTFVDEELDKFYKLKTFYNMKHPTELIGHLIIGIAPHTSAGIVGRIVGFSKTSAILAHPYWHDAQRRDCLTFNSFVPIFDGKNWELKKIGEKINELNPKIHVDSFKTLGAKVNNHKTIGLNFKTKKFEEIEVKEFTKHTPYKGLLKIETEAGKITTTEDHKFFIKEKEKIIEKEASKLKITDKLIKPYKIEIPSKNKEEINLLELFEDQKSIMIRGLKEFLKEILNKETPKSIQEKYLLKKYQYNNYFTRDSFPITFVKKILENHKKTWKNLPLNKIFLGVSRDTAKIPPIIPLNKEVLEILGLYVADGYCRKKDKEFYQVAIASVDEEIRDKIKETFRKYFNLKPSSEQINITFSSKILYELFKNKLKLGERAKEKRIPPEFLNLHLNKLKYLISGYFEGDGSVSKTDCRVAADSISEGLLADLAFILARFGIFTKTHSYEKRPGPIVREFYEKKKREIPNFKITKITIPSDFVKKFEEINFISTRKREILKYLLTKKINGTKIENDNHYIYPKIKKITKLPPEETYCMTTETGNFLANDFLVHNCDGEETSIILMMDAFLNFSREYLPAKRGGTMDAPLVLSTVLNPEEIDDEVFDVDTCWNYPLEFYRAAIESKTPWSIPIDQIKNRIGKESQYEGMGYTHEITNLNDSVTVSSYKSLPTMMEKMEVQMELANKIRAVDPAKVAALIINGHFMRDIKGNLRKFSQQKVRCVKCNEKYQRPPLSGVCNKCGGKIIFTISEGTLKKYLEPSLELATKENVPNYLKQSLEIVKDRIDTLFGKEKTKQVGLSAFK